MTLELIFYPKMDGPLPHFIAETIYFLLSHRSFFLHVDEWLDIDKQINEHSPISCTLEILSCYLSAYEGLIYIAGNDLCVAWCSSPES